MLVDHGRDVEQAAASCRDRKAVSKEWGQMLTDLAPWDWFVTFTFRGKGRNYFSAAKSGFRCRQRQRMFPVREKAFEGISAADRVLRDLQCQRSFPVRDRTFEETSEDGLIFPHRHRLGLPPVRDKSLEEITEYFAAVESEAACRIGWVLAEEFGRTGGRWHCHGLVTGVRELNRKFWWAEAYRRFGHSKILPFNPEQAAAFYTAKYAAKALGEIHFKGILKGVDFNVAKTSVTRTGEGIEIVRSVELSKGNFRSGLARWHR